MAFPKTLNVRYFKWKIGGGQYTELELYNHNSITQNLALHKNATSNGKPAFDYDHHPGRGNFFATDGSNWSGVGSYANGNILIVIDLEASYMVDRGRMSSNHHSIIGQYALYGSLDSSKADGWVKLYEGSDSVPWVMHSFTPTKARYIKLTAV